MSEHPTASQEPCVVYLHHRFPTLTATFVYREIAALERQGVRVANVACKRPAENDVHAEARRFLSVCEYLPPATHPRLYAEAIAEILRHPLKCFSAVWRVIAANRGRRAGAWGEVIRGLVLARRIRVRSCARHIHAPFSTETATMAWLAWRLTGIPFSFTSHTAFDARMIPEKVRDAAWVAAISRFDRARLIRESGTNDPDKLRWIHCGVVRCAESGRSDADPPRILSVGSLAEKKGHAILIRACAVLKRRGVRFRCRIVGSGPLRENLDALVVSESVADCVQLAGPRDQDDVRQELAEATVFCLASIYAANGDLDGIPVVLMEAMAAGVPCVSTTVSGIPELIESPCEGILVPEKDPVALADALERLLKDPALRASISAAARRKVEREFDIEQSAAQLAELFRRCGRMDEANGDRLHRRVAENSGRGEEE